MEEKIIYRLDNDISFRKCDLFSGAKVAHGNCTSFSTKEKNWTEYYSCNQEGIHFHCTKHPEIEFDYVSSDPYQNRHSVGLTCPKCGICTDIGNKQALIERCLRVLNRELFKDAKLVRLDDWYTPELKEKTKPSSDYRLATAIKTDRDGDTIVVLYVSHVGTQGKVQYFIKPEKGQLANDHKDLDPAKIISKIEVTLKDRTLTQIYRDEQA